MIFLDFVLILGIDRPVPAFVFVLTGEMVFLSCMAGWWVGKLHSKVSSIGLDSCENCGSDISSPDL